MADRIWKKVAPIDATDHVVFDLPEAGYMTRVGGPMLVQEGIDSKTGLPFTRLKSGCVGVDRSQ